MELWTPEKMNGRKYLVVYNWGEISLLIGVSELVGAQLVDLKPLETNILVVPSCGFVSDNV